MNEFLTAIDFTLNSTYFQYNNKYYAQINGLAMGAPISATASQLVLEDLENHTLTKITETKILKKENNPKARVIHEMIKIQQIENSINDRTDIKNLSTIYYNLLTSIK